MLRLFMQSLDRLLGPALTGIASAVYLAGWVVLGLAFALPLWRLWLRRQEARAGVRRVWTVPCARCGPVAPVFGRTCVQCGQPLGLPLAVRLRALLHGFRAGVGSPRLMLGYHGAGLALFGLIVLWVVGHLAALGARGALERLFVGLGLLALAAFGRGAGRALGLRPHGLIGRTADAVQAFAAVGVLAICALLAGQSRPITERVLVTFFAGDAGAGGALPTLQPTGEGEAGLEYLQVDHEVLGYRRIVPLALVGAAPRPLPQRWPATWAVPRLRRDAERWGRRGLTVRVRRDLQAVTLGTPYDVVERQGQVQLRPRGAPSSAPAAAAAGGATR
ncbi:MAG TPA: hypothetical protein VGQ83_42750 [Polyangia bacterium]|jgi:hypothetical protein